VSVTAIVVDDEPLARAGLQALVESTPDYRVIATCADGPSAVAAILQHAPDVVLLDVQMPGFDGVDVARRIGAATMPYLIFVTAFDAFTIEAFELHALDYILKPYTDERLRAALAHAADSVRRRALADMGERVAAALGELAPAHLPEPADGERSPRRLALRSARSVKYVDVDEILWIEADSYYVRLHVPGKSLLYREALHSLARRLDGRFMRVHRSAIVRIDAIVELRRDDDNDVTALLRDGSRVPVSRSRVAMLEERLIAR